MKVTFAALMVLVAIIFAQIPRPIPLPSLNLTKVPGLWYVVAGYLNSNFIGVDCFTQNVTVLNSTAVSITLAGAGSGYNIPNTVEIECKQ